jgi:uncharacterized protein YfdQ (DUF2303 family)
MSVPNLDLALLRDIIEGGMSPVSGSCLVPNGFSLESTERFLLEPNALRGTYTANSIAEFAGYISDPANVATPRVFIDAPSMRAVARLDHGDVDAPGWGKHRAVLELQATPGYAAFVDTTRNPLTQESLIDYVTDWADALAFSTTAHDLPWVDMKPTAAIQALRKIATEVRRDATHVEADRARERTVFEKAAISSAPPAQMQWSGLAYEELAERQICARLAYLPKDPPLIRVRVIALDQLRKALADEFRDRVRAAIGDTNIPVHIGSFSDKS